MAALAYSPQTPHAKAGQTQITLLGTSITGSVFALAHCVEKYFYEIRIGAMYSVCVCVCVCKECVWGDTSITEWNKLLWNEFKVEKQIGEVDEERAESLVTTSISNRYSAARVQRQTSRWPTLCHRMQSFLRRRTPCWTPDELACICGSWADQAMWLGEASAPYLGDY